MSQKVRFFALVICIVVIVLGWFAFKVDEAIKEVDCSHAGYSHYVHVNNQSYCYRIDDSGNAVLRLVEDVRGEQ